MSLLRIVFQKTAIITNRATLTMPARSPGVIEPRATIASSLRSVLFRRKVCGLPILSPSRCASRARKTSRTATASDRGWSGTGFQFGTDSADAARRHDAEDHPADRLELGVIERIGGVARRVIVGVLARAEEQVGDLAGAERPVVAAVEQEHVGPEHADRHGPALRRRRDPGPEPRSVLAAHHEDVRSADTPERPADHVGGDEQPDLVERHGRVLDEVARPEKPDLLQVETEEHDAPLRRLGRQRQRPGDLEHHRDARRVVVGAGEEDAPPDAQVVEMGRHDDPLVAQRRVGAEEPGADVAAEDFAGRALDDRLGVRAVEERLELQAAERLDQVFGGLPPPLAPTALELGGGEREDLGPEPRLVGLGGLRPRRGGRGRQPGEQESDRCDPSHHRVPATRAVLLTIERGASPQVRMIRINGSTIERNSSDSPRPVESCGMLAHVRDSGLVHGGGSCRVPHGSRRSPSRWR